MNQHHLSTVLLASCPEVDSIYEVVCWLRLISGALASQDVALRIMRNLPEHGCF